ncbi:MAG: 30S ribosomal protein S17 [Elusimicrobia bacterium RIFOXYA2_FULL_39_19]|nr:MAG: 30S ribosomal protein S17 [Elusimicrobia bacterium RIFOXYA2_FULL_39_19]
MSKLDNRKTCIGIVLSDKMNKSRVIGLEQTVRHSKYQKVLRRTKKLYAHDENNQSKIGDIVKIVETKPLSKMKRWSLVKIIRTKSEVIVK